MFVFRDDNVIMSVIAPDSGARDSEADLCIRKRPGKPGDTYTVAKQVRSLQGT